VSLPDDPACNEIVEIVTAFLEDALTAADRVRFEQHLVVCEACAVYVEQMRETVRLTGRFGAPELTPQARESFVALLRGWKRGGARSL